MNAGPDVERRVSDWLAEEVPTRAPDRILPAAFERTRHARQRRFGAAWRSISMNRTWQRDGSRRGHPDHRPGGRLYRRLAGSVGGPPAATPSPSPTPIPLSLMKAGEAGTYVIDGPFAVDGIVTTIDAGFDYGNDATASGVNLSIPSDGGAPAWMTFNIVDEVYPDPCGVPEVPTSTPLGPTVDTSSQRLEASRAISPAP